MTPTTTDPRAILQHHLDQALYIDALAQFVLVPLRALAQVLVISEELQSALIEAEKVMEHFGNVLNGMDCVAEVEEDTGISNDWVDGVFEQVRAALAKAGRAE